MRSSTDRGPATTPVALVRPGQAEPGAPGRDRRRSFTADYKLEVLAAYDAAEPGEKSEILRREGLYSSHIVDWRRTRDAGAYAALARPRGRPAADPRDARIAQLGKERARLERDLATARFVAGVQTTTVSVLGDALRGSGHRSEADTVIDQAIAALAPWVGTRAACAAVGESQASYYRRHRASPPGQPARIPPGAKPPGQTERDGQPAREPRAVLVPATPLTSRRSTGMNARTTRLSKS
jgi:transposase